jgi:ABC-type antimicrobial peptide transport system permease subunit
VQRLTARIGVAALPISLAALLAAVVVITNTMLVSVTERTREIGVRRAVGASATDITREVIAESSLVAIVGGVAGLALVWLVALTAADALGIPLRLKMSTIGWSLGAAALSGIAAGWYPARRAIGVDVVSALRAD